MALLFICEGEDPTEWDTTLRAEIPDLDMRVWPDGVGNPDEIDIVLTWQPPRGLLATFPNLKAILSLAAGIEHILRDPELPPAVPNCNSAATLSLSVTLAAAAPAKPGTGSPRESSSSTTAVPGQTMESTRIVSVIVCHNECHNECCSAIMRGQYCHIMRS